MSYPVTPQARCATSQRYPAPLSFHGPLPAPSNKTIRESAEHGPAAAASTGPQWPPWRGRHYTRGGPSISSSAAPWTLPRGRGRRRTGRSSPWRASTGAGRTEAPLPGPPAGSGPCPRGSTGDQINTQPRREGHATKGVRLTDCASWQAFGRPREKQPRFSVLLFFFKLVKKKRTTFPMPPS